MLQTSQANALVYTTLVGFGFVGFYAGYRVKNKTDFLSGIRTQGGELNPFKEIKIPKKKSIVLTPKFILQPFLWHSIGLLQVS